MESKEVTIDLEDHSPSGEEITIKKGVNVVNFLQAEGEKMNIFKFRNKLKIEDPDSLTTMKIKDHADFIIEEYDLYKAKGNLFYPAQKDITLYSDMYRRWSLRMFKGLDVDMDVAICIIETVGYGENLIPSGFNISFVPCFTLEQLTNLFLNLELDFSEIDPENTFVLENRVKINRSLFRRIVEGKFQSKYNDLTS